MSAAIAERESTQTLATELLDRAVRDAKARALRSPVAEAGIPSQSIVVTLDGSPFSLAALEPALAMARCFHLPLVLVEAVHPAENPYLDPDMNEAQGETNAYKTLHAAATAARATGLEVSEVVVKRPLADDPAAAILEAAAAFNAKLIVMATHGRTGISRVLHGSVADQVIHGTDVPVLVVRPRQ
jgi:nucleotide-binding universal stress UspA family protein